MTKKRAQQLHDELKMSDDFNHVIKVNPQRITPSTKLGTMKRDALEAIDEGVSIEKTHFYNELKTNWHNYPNRQRDHGTPLNRLKWFKDIYQDIKHNGYEYVTGKEDYAPMFVIVTNGGLIYCHDGHHRLAILHHINQTEPITVHAYYDEEIQKARGLIKDRYEEGCYHPILHPAFHDFPAKQGGRKTYRKRAKLVQQQAPQNTNNILDIGACTGYYSATLAKQLNATVQGIERSDRWYAIHAALSDWYNKYFGNIDVIKKDFENYNQGSKFDMVICLSVLHHYIKQSEQATVGFVNKIKQHTGKVAIVEVATEKENQMQQLDHLDTPTDISYWKQLLQQTNFSSIESIPNRETGRYFFRLE